MMIEIVQKAKEALLETLFPAFCARCKKEGKYLCEKCSVFVSEVAFICSSCERPSFLGETHVQCASRYGLDGIISLWEYEGVLKELLHAIKYQGIRDAVSELAENGRKVMESDLYRFRAFLEFLAQENTVISFVPMHIRREKRRGFNQAQDMALQLATLAQSKPVIPTLKKIKDTSSQADLNREQRLRNLRGVFQSKFDFNIPRNVILVDDVWTTGATMRECCKVLKKSGIEKVWGFTLARTV